MRKTVVFLLIFIISLSLFAVPVSAAERPATSSEAVYVVDTRSGAVLYAKNIDKRLYPASTTKIMTALLVYEHAEKSGGLDKMITANRSAVVNDNLHAAGSTAGIMAGEQMTVLEYLYCLLVSSANEVGNVLAEYVSGDVDAFVKLMNERAAQLGCKGTRFENPHGLHNENHYTTAYDLYLISQEFAKHEKLMEIANTVNYTIKPTNKYKSDRILLTTNYLITTRKTEKYYYRQARGIKTGYTSQAGNCLVSSAEQDEMKIISVVMHAPVATVAGTNYAFEDTVKLFNWAFASYGYREISVSGTPVVEIDVRFALDKDRIVLATAQPFTMLVALDEFDPELVTVEPVDLPDRIDAPVTKGEIVGKAAILYDGEPQGEVDIAALTTVEMSNFLYYSNKVLRFLGSPLFLIILFVVIGLVIAYIVFMLMSNKRRRRYRSVKNYRKKY